MMWLAAKNASFSAAAIKERVMNSVKICVALIVVGLFLLTLKKCGRVSE